MASVNDILKKSFNTKIFSLNRLRYEEMWEDALKYIKKVYNSENEEFNSSSPFAQLLSVFIHLGRMIIYYIEDSINGLNITTAWRPEQIRGLAQLTGHDPARCVAARANVTLTYNGSDNDYTSKIIYIPNRLKMSNVYNGLDYVLELGENTIRMTLNPGNYINANIVQGKVTYQRATSDGSPFQSFNFAEKNYRNIDQYYIYVYVNGEPWRICSSLLDMSYNSHTCVVRTGQTSGLDIFFGNGDFGAIPEQGAEIRVEYITTSGTVGNFYKEYMNASNYWQIEDKAYLADGTEVDLTNLMTIECKTDCILGAYNEDITLTQRIAPYSSRSMVLANATNYRYFLEKMNMFSVIDVLQGFNTTSDRAAEFDYQNAQSVYYTLKNQYENAVNLYGVNSDTASQLSKDLTIAKKNLSQALTVLNNEKMDDNTVYLFLVPNIINRIGTENYFTCEENTTFKLTPDEKYNILNLIDMSGQSIISVENKILDGKYPRFSINISVRKWQGYDFENVYSSIISELSKYFIGCTRRDRIPVSDIVALLENINSIDSVSVYFDADPNNVTLYGNNFNGIDEYGDVVLERTVINKFGEEVVIRDLYPLFRGGFTTSDGIEYSDVQQPDVLSAVNVNITGTSSYNLETNIENKLVNE